MSDVALATSSLAFEQRLRRACNGTLNGNLTRWRDATELYDADAALLDLARQDPAVVVLGPDVPVDQALVLATAVDQEWPEISVVLAASPSPDLLRRALQAGVRDLIAPDASDQEVRKVFDQAMEHAMRRRHGRGGPDGGPNGSRGTVITVIAPKGGSGKTAVASNVAVGLAQAVPGETVIVDLDLQFGDLPTVLGLEPQHDIGDATRSSSSLNIANLKVFLTRHESGLYVLAAPDSPAEGEEVAESRARRVIDLLAGEFQFVVVDTSAGITEHTLGALELSTDVILVCDLSITSARGTRKVVDALDQLGMTGQARHLVLNRADSDVGLDPADVDAIVGMPVEVELPSTRSVPLSMNQGAPLITRDPRAPITKRFHEIVGRFAEVEAERSNGLFGRRRNR